MSKKKNNSEDMILNKGDDISPTLNEIFSKENEKSNNNNNNENSSSTLPTNLSDSKIAETQPLSLNIIKKNKENTSAVLQIPQNTDINLNTLDESVYITIKRDLDLIYTKLKLVMNPFIPKEKKYAQIRQWDLWGPLLLNIILAFTLTLNTKEKGQMTALIFIIFWLGGSIIYLNNYFLEVKTSIFQIYCLLGYCLFPLNISALIVTIINSYDFFRLIVVGISCYISIKSSSDYLNVITNNEQRYLVLYPCILFYLYIAWFIFSTKR